MTQSLVIIELVLVACIVGGWVLGRLLSARIATRRGDDAAEESEGSLTDALAFVGAAFGIILGLLLVMHLGDRRRLAAISVSAITVVLLVIVGSLTNLDYPFEGSIGNLKPVAMESSLMSLQQAFPDSDWSPCEQLAAPTQG